MISFLLHVSFQLNLSLRLSQCPQSLTRETPPRTKMAFATTALAHPRWVTATESTLASAGPGPRAYAPAVPTSARVPWVGQALEEQRQQSSPGSSHPRLCRRGCRGSWGPACRSTVTAADAAKAVPPGRRNLLYQRVSILYVHQAIMTASRVQTYLHARQQNSCPTNSSNTCLLASLTFCISLSVDHKSIRHSSGVKI